MSTLIATDVQKQEISSPVIDLYELTLPGGGTLFFHAGLDDDLTDVQFNTFDAPYTVNDYDPIPIIMDGLDLQADGATNRPTLTVANLNNFRNQLGGYSNDDLVGQTITRRRTLKKYLVGEASHTLPPVEFRRATYKIDRIGSESPLSVTFECAVPYDLEGIQLPRRVIVGKYCSWEYQGHELRKRGGCTWKLGGVRNFSTDNSTQVSHEYFFDVKDRPLVKASNLSSVSAWSGGTSYTLNSYVKKDITVTIILTIAESAAASGAATASRTYTRYFLCQLAHSSSQDPFTDTAGTYWKEVFAWTDWSSSSVSYKAARTNSDNSEVLIYSPNYVKHNNTIWQCIGEHTSAADKAPPNPTTTGVKQTSPYWRQFELCGKTLQSCKCRFQATPISNSSANQPPSATKNTNIILPFGAFPGSSKY